MSALVGEGTGDEYVIARPTVNYWVRELRSASKLLFASIKKNLDLRAQPDKTVQQNPYTNFILG